MGVFARKTKELGGDVFKNDFPSEEDSDETAEYPEPEAPSPSQPPPVRRKGIAPDQAKKAERDQAPDTIGLTTRIRADLHQRLKFHAFLNSRPISKVIEELAETLPPVPQVYAKP